MKNVSMTRTINRVLASAATFLFVTSGMLSAQTGKSYSQLKAEHPGWVQIPGKLISPDCVHEVPNGARVEFGDNGEPTGDVTMNGQVIAHYDPCPEAGIDTRHLGGSKQEPSYGDGWVETSQWELSLGASDNIDYMFGYWNVPAAPKDNGALIYLWNGIEPTGGNWVLQPVLQYGNGSRNGGGNYWGIGSWLVGPDNYAFYSPLEKVHSGDLIQGYTEQTGVSGSTDDYFVSAQDMTSGAYSTISIHISGEHWVWAFAGVLEAYNVTSCSEYPASGSTQFFDSYVAHGYPNYEFVNPEEFYGAYYNYFGSGGPQCNFNVAVSGSTSTLYF
ncbi:MAG: hypothetical protein ABSG07_05515 [Terriglobales bacterium]|jgi:hypothetical protein